MKLESLKEFQLENGKDEIRGGDKLPFNGRWTQLGTEFPHDDVMVENNCTDFEYELWGKKHLVTDPNCWPPLP